jgi:hypothetical protein
LRRTDGQLLLPAQLLLAFLVELRVLTARRRALECSLALVHERTEVLVGAKIRADGLLRVDRVDSFVNPRRPSVRALGLPVGAATRGLVLLCVRLLPRIFRRLAIDSTEVGGRGQL